MGAQLGGALTRRRLATLGGVLFLLQLPAFFAPSIAPAMDALYPSVNLTNPYFSGLDPLLLYGALPLCVLGSLVLAVAPGILWVLLLGRANTPAQCVLYGFAMSVLLIGGTTTAVQSVSGAPLTGTALVGTILGLEALLFGIAWWRLARGVPLRWPAWERQERWVTASTFFVPLLLLVALTPKFFWESLNDDGVQAFECARLLLHQPVPFWPESGGEYMASYPGMSTAANLYPASWFVGLFGDFEGAARIPFLLFLAALHAGVVAVAQSASERRLGLAGHTLLWASLVSYALVMCYSATYDPYCADIGLPATQDTMLMASFLGVVVAYVRKERGWMALFTLLTLTTSPGGVLLLAGSLLGLLVASRPWPWREVTRLAVGFAICVAATAAAPAILRSLGLPAPGGEHGPKELIQKFYYLYPIHLKRVAFAVVPCGIYPVAALFAWRRSDTVTRALVVATAVTFGLYYVIARVSLHYFVPAMVLPIVVFWRLERTAVWKRRSLGLALCSTAAAVAVGLGLPRTTAVYTATRDLGRQFDIDAMPGYEGADPRAFRSLMLLAEIFPFDYDTNVPHSIYGGSPLAWNYYARRARPGSRRNYVLVPADAPAPEGATLVARDEVAAVYVHDPRLWEEQRVLMPPGSQGREIYAIPRDLLFLTRAARERSGIVPVRDWAKSLLGRGEEE